MEKSNLELFMQAINEGLSNKINRVADSYTNEIVCSEKHNLAMRAIVYGKTDSKRVWSPRMKRIIAIIIAAALLLTSCGIIFRNEIREIIKEVFVILTYSDDETGAGTIEEVYELGYLPDGYSLSSERIRPLCVQYEFVNESGEYIWFEQTLMDGSAFIVDNENGYSRIEEIGSYEVYYRYTNNHVYVWSDDKYSMLIRSELELHTSEIIKIFNGIKVK